MPERAVWVQTRTLQSIIQWCYAHLGRIKKNLNYGAERGRVSTNFLRIEVNVGLWVFGSHAFILMIRLETIRVMETPEYFESIKSSLPCLDFFTMQCDNGDPLQYGPSTGFTANKTIGKNWKHVEYLLWKPSSLPSSSEIAVLSRKS